MKLMHTTTTNLNTKEFNKLSDRIIDSLYDLSPDLQDLYDIHINYINDSWHVDFVPISGKIPVINVDTYVSYNSGGDEILHITPKNLTDIPGSIPLGNNGKSYDLCMNYAAIFEFITSLYDFEYEL